MLTPGCFVCHVHCLVHDGVVRSSPCGPHHENFGRNLYHMFVSAYSASQILCFVFSRGIRVALKSNVDSIPFLNSVLIFLCAYLSFLIIEIAILILFPTGAFLFKMIPSFSPSARSILSFFSTVFIPTAPSCLCFSHPPSFLFFFKD